MVDENDLFRVGLASLLAAREPLEIVAQASGGTMGVRLAAESRPDVILMDLRLSDLDGPAAARAMLEHDESARIIALTTLGAESDVRAAIEAGFCGYVLKDASVDDLVAAIRAAADRMAWLSPCAAEAVLTRFRRGHFRAAQAPELSPREIEVLQAIARGADNDEIAAELSISPHTAKNHVSAILSKLGVDNRVQAAVRAVKTRERLKRPPTAPAALVRSSRPHRSTRARGRW
jgi:DNA-binding NarL/FixJ family response regulator